VLLTGKLLKTLDLRNMFIDTQDLEEMPLMTSFTMRCVKVNGGALQDINDRMQNLLTLALLGVFGVTNGNLTFPNMKVLCLGLSTMAKDVTICLPNLVKLQLKMQCPEKLSLNAPSLQFIAFNLEVPEMMRLELRNICSLQEVLYGASNFDTLVKIIRTNRNIDKVFLDIPCMALGEDGKWLGVLKGIPLNLPSFAQLHECEKLGVLNIGPGLWHSMEENLDLVVTVDKWPPVKRLIVHMIPQNLDTCLAIFHILLKSTLTSLEINVHTNSPVEYDVIIPRVKDMVTGYGPCFIFNPKPWTKSLDFSCFTF
jgi:hypothetical protein